MLFGNKRFSVFEDANSIKTVDFLAKNVSSENADRRSFNRFFIDLGFGMEADKAGVVQEQNFTTPNGCNLIGSSIKEMFDLKIEIRVIANLIFFAKIHEFEYDVNLESRAVASVTQV